MDQEIFEKIRDELVEIKINLAEHMRRTEAAEKRLDVVERLAEEVRILLPQVRNLLKWWPVVSGAVLVVVVGKPEALTQLLNLLSK